MVYLLRIIASTSASNACATKNCTNEDIDLLNSRCKAFLKPSELEVADVSLIVGRNIFRDVCNEEGVEAFANKNGLSVWSFAAVDHLPKCSHLADAMLDMLLDLQPCRTEHLPGILSLCQGLPVLITDNQATKLCVTNGAEAIVCGWNHFEKHDRLHLSVVFVELLSPPRPVQLDGLPLNVVPIIPIKESIDVKLRSYEIQKIVWQQVPLLPNFAMTDYASQGRTCPINPVDLKFCVDHRSYYTALSRSTSLSGTYILDSVDLGKIQGGLSGYQHQEFRELEILAHITQLRLPNKLPTSIKGESHKDLLATYAAHFGRFFCPPNMPAELDNPNGISEDACDLPNDAMEVDNENSTHLITSQSPGLKRKRDSEGETPFRPAKRQNSGRLQDVLYLGCTWDAVNYSCAYDSFYTLIFSLYRSYSNLHTRQAYTRLGTLCLTFDQLPQPVTTYSLNNLRDQIHCELYAFDSDSFPMGCNLTSLLDLVELYMPVYGIQSVEEGRLTYSPTRISSILAVNFHCNYTYATIPLKLSLPLDDSPECSKDYTLVAGIYWGADHFTARFLLDSKLYWYDGIVDGQLQLERVQVLDEQASSWSTLARRPLYLAFYLLNRL
jgi:hypothetical protein